MAIHSTTIEDRLLATHISNNPAFEEACLTGNVAKVMQIIEQEAEMHNLHTTGAKKLRDDIIALTHNKEKVSVKVGENILFFVWNSRLAGTGFAVSA
jgi:alpha-galactosidase/6-phospho-beta-glucosidase family protein